MDRLGDMRLFTEAAALGSLSAAGRKLGLSPAAASARLLKLEKSLTARLFERTTRQLRLTDEGRLYLQHCRIALQAIDDGEAALHAGLNLVRGKVRISATSDFGRNLLCHWLDEFSRLYPDVSFSLAPNRRVLCASPEYLARHGEPKTPADLATHTFTVLVTSTATFNQFDFVRGDERFTHIVPLDDAWETNDGALSRAWALAGQGIAHKSIWDIAADVRSGALKILLADWCSNEAAVHAVFHGNRYMAPRVRVLLDFLIERFARATAELLGDLAYPPGQQGHDVERTL